MPKSSGFANPLVCTNRVPATAAIAEPSTNIVTRRFSVGTPNVAATCAWSRPAIASRCTTERASQIASSITRPSAMNHTQNVA